MPKCPPKKKPTIVYERIEPHIRKSTQNGTARFVTRFGSESKSHLTYAKAFADKCVRSAVVAAQKQAQKQAENAQRVGAARAFEESDERQANLAKNGGNCALERDFCLRLKALFETQYPGLKFIVMNDKTVSDVILAVSPEHRLFTCVQVKTTGKVNDDTGTVQFRKVLGYDQMPVLCWCEATDQVWIADGTKLHQKGAENVSFKADGSTLHKRKEVLTKTALSPSEAIDWLVKESTIEGKWRRMDPESASWHFNGVKDFKERVSLHLYMLKHPEARFPTDQNGPFDVVDQRDGRDLRVQAKTATKAKAGVYISVHESSGQKTDRAYAEDSFDVLRAYYVDYKRGKYGYWQLEGDALTPLFRTDAHDGHKSFVAHAPVAASKALGLKVVDENHHLTTNLHTRAWFRGPFKLPALPEAAERPGAHFLKELRAGR